MILLIISMIFAIIVALFAIQNAYTVSISFLWLQTDIPLVLVILGSAFAGAVIVFLVALWREFNLRRQNKAKCTEAIKAAEHKADEKREVQKAIDSKSIEENISTEMLEPESSTEK